MKRLFLCLFLVGCQKSVVENDSPNKLLVTEFGKLADQAYSVGLSDGFRWAKLQGSEEDLKKLQNAFRNNGRCDPKSGELTDDMKTVWTHQLYKSFDIDESEFKKYDEIMLRAEKAAKEGKDGQKVQ